MLDMIAGLGSALSTLKSLTQAVTTVANVELRIELNTKIADLQSQILGAQQQMLDMQGRYEALLAENTALKDAERRRVEAKPKIKWGCYTFDDDGERLYCPGCYDRKGQKH